MRLPPEMHDQLRLAMSPFGLLLLARMLLVCASFGSLPYLTLLLTDQHSLSPEDAAVLLGLLTISNQGGALPAGLAVDRFGARAILAVTAVTSMTCIFAMAAAPHGQPPLLGILLVIHGFCVTCHVAGFRVAVPVLLSGDQLATGYALSETARIAGKLLGPSATMFFVATGAYRNAFVVSSVFYGLGGLCAVVALRRHQAGPQSVGPRLPRSPDRVPASLVVAAALVICVAQLSLVQMTTWMPKYFAEIGRGGAPPIVFIASSAFAAPLLAMAAPLIKRWNPNALVLAITSGSACLSVGFAIVPWAEGVHPLLPIGVLVLTSIVAELTVVPSTNVFVARVTSRHWLGLAFGVVSLSESVGGIAGVYLGAQLFAQAVGGDGLSTYWFRIAAVTAMLLAATYAVKVVADVAISILSKRL